LAKVAKRNGRVTATVRINPHPSKSKTFDTLRDAKLWAKEIEVKLSSETQGDYSHITLQIALERYRDEIIPSHRGADRDINRINRIMRGELPMQLPLKSITKYHILEGCVQNLNIPIGNLNTFIGEGKYNSEKNIY
jgi:hypothetical protein